MRATANLTARLERNLIAYATAGGAAGVAMLVSSPPVEAKIIYTATHQVIGPYEHYNLDLNHDGVTDVVLFQTNSCTDWCWNTLGVSGDGSIESRLPYHSATALRKGSLISSNKRFRRGSFFAPVTMVRVVGTTSDTFVRGPWVNVKNRYLGLKFTFNGKTHFGWARMNVDVTHGITGTLTGYAYETIPHKAIIAGNRGSTTGQGAEAQPVSLGHLALGAAGRKQHHQGVLTSH